MKITIENVKKVFLEWNQHCLENPMDVNNEPVTSENIDDYSQEQANEFVERMKGILEVE